MFSLAISSMRSRWRVSSRPMIAATAGSASSRLSCQKRCSGLDAAAWGEAELIVSGVLRDRGKLGDAARMAVPGEIGGEEGFEAGLGHLDPDQPGAERDGVGIVMRAREPGRKRLRHQ